MNLNDLVEVAPGVKKPLGECTRADFKGAAEMFEVKAIRNRAAADRLEAGLPPACDGRNADGTWCENDSVFMKVGNAAPDEPIGLCAKHADEKRIGACRA